MDFIEFCDSISIISVAHNMLHLVEVGIKKLW